MTDSSGCHGRARVRTNGETRRSMDEHDPTTRAAAGEIDVLRAILAGTSGERGAPFFARLVESLAAVLQTRGVWITEYLKDRRQLRALAFWYDGQWVADYEYDVDGTP